jgi:putative membrane protein
VMHWYGDNINAWGWLGMTLGMLAFWGLLAAGFYLIFRSPDRNNQFGTVAGLPQTPEQMLAARFARGEIDDTEFHARLTTLHAAVRS